MQIARSKAPLAARLALGGVFFVFGLNGFLRFLPQPAPPPPEALAFVVALVQTGYMLPLIKGTEVVAGLLLLSGRCVPFALTLLAPIVVNIVAYHAILDPGFGSLIIAFTVLALGLYLAWTERAVFKPLFQSPQREASAGVNGVEAGAHGTT